MKVLCVSTESVSLEGTAPAQGDEVDFSARGRVQRVEGDKAYIEVDEVNGAPLPEESAEVGDDEMLDLAKKADEAASLPREDV